MSEEIIEQAARVMYEGFTSAASQRKLRAGMDTNPYQPWNWVAEGIKDNNRIRARALAAAGLLAQDNSLTILALALQRIEKALAVMGNTDEERRIRAILTGESTEDPARKRWLATSKWAPGGLDEPGEVQS